MGLFSKKTKVEDFKLLKDKLDEHSNTENIPQHIKFNKTEITLKEIKEFIDKDVDAKFEVFIEFLNEERKKTNAMKKELDLLKKHLIFKDIKSNTHSNNEYMINEENLKFILYNGIKLSSLNDLLENLKTMSDDVFVHHVNSERNDFASWVKYVLKLENLSKQLYAFKAKKDIISAIETFIKN